MSPSKNSIPIRNVIFGLSGIQLTDQEKLFFKEVNPLGFILFKRNCNTKEQIKSLNDSLKALLARDDILILIDQEGGRVARLTPPNFRKTIPAKVFGDIAVYDLEKAKTAVYINHLLIGRELRDLGINVDCAPVADLLHKGASDVIGDRSFGNDPFIVSELCKAADIGLRDGKVQSIIKHIPGHGRADKDSHYELPSVKEDLEILKATDFKVFQSLSELKLAMTAHVVYHTIDPQNAATISSLNIDYIRNQLNFKGLLITDDLSMKALTGSPKENAVAAMEAKCDILLHCNGNMEEMKEIALVAEYLTQDQMQKVYNLNNFFDFQPLYKALYDMESAELEKMLSNFTQV